MTTTELLSIQETAKRLGLTRPTVYEMIELGQLRAVAAGHYRRIPAWQVQNIALGRSIEEGPVECQGCGHVPANAAS